MGFLHFSPPFCQGRVYEVRRAWRCFAIVELSKVCRIVNVIELPSYLILHSYPALSGLLSALHCTALDSSFNLQDIQSCSACSNKHRIFAYAKPANYYSANSEAFTTRQPWFDAPAEHFSGPSLPSSKIRYLLALVRSRSCDILFLPHATSRGLLDRMHARCKLQASRGA